MVTREKARAVTNVDSRVRRMNIELALFSLPASAKFRQFANSKRRSGRIVPIEGRSALPFREFVVTKKKVALGLLSGVFMTSPVLSAPLPNLQGQAYVDARARMIKLGYHPVRFVRTEDGCLLDKSCNRYPELLGCSPQEPARCRFAFKSPDGLTYAVVSTRGEKTRRVYSIATASPRERKKWPIIARR
jgi:hypothetical protein